MKTLLFYLLVPVAFCSCLNQKYLAKGQVVFKVEQLPKGKSEIKAYSTGNHNLHVKLQIDTSGTLLIQNVDTVNNGKGLILPTVVVSSFKTTDKYSLLSATGNYYFPETTFPQTGDLNSNNLFISPARLKYFENRLVFQIVTTPIKIRPTLNKIRLKDSLPLQALAELNIGGALGLKRTWSYYRASTNDNGQHLSSISLSGSAFFSVGGTNVKRVATRNFIQYDKTLTAISFGSILFFGYNNLNLGISVGADHLVSNSDIKKHWIYDGLLWYGITLGYDIGR